MSAWVLLKGNMVGLWHLAKCLLTLFFLECSAFHTCTSVQQQDRALTKEETKEKANRVFACQGRTYLAKTSGCKQVLCGPTCSLAGALPVKFGVNSSNPRRNEVYILLTRVRAYVRSALYSFILLFSVLLNRFCFVLFLNNRWFRLQ